MRKIQIDQYIERSLDELLTINGGAVVVLAGDFNQLNVEELSARTGLIPLVHVPTRGHKILDMVMASPLAPYHVKVVSSTVKTDHKAVVATLEGNVRDRSKHAEKRF